MRESVSVWTEPLVRLSLVATASDTPHQIENAPFDIPPCISWTIGRYMSPASRHLLSLSFLRRLPRSYWVAAAALCCLVPMAHAECVDHSKIQTDRLGSNSDGPSGLPVTQSHSRDDENIGWLGSIVPS